MSPILCTQMISNEVRYLKYPGNDYRNYLAHALNTRRETVNNGNWGNGRGSWSNHKYVRKEGNRYIYPEDLKSDHDTPTGTGKDRFGNSTRAKRADPWRERLSRQIAARERAANSQRLANSKAERDYRNSIPGRVNQYFNGGTVTEEDMRKAEAMSSPNQTIAPSGTGPSRVEQAQSWWQQNIANPFNEWAYGKEIAGSRDRVKNDGAFEQIGNWWQQNVANPFNNWAYGKEDDPNDGAFERIRNAPGDVGRWVENTWNNARNGFNNWAYGKEDDPNDGAFERIGNGVTNAWNTVRNAPGNLWYGSPEEVEQSRRIADASGPDAQPRATGLRGTLGRASQRAVNAVSQTGDAIGDAVGRLANNVRTEIQQAPTNIGAQAWVSRTGGAANVYNNYATQINEALERGDQQRARSIQYNGLAEMERAAALVMNYIDNLHRSGADENTIARYEKELDAISEARSNLMNGPF